jgi:hypothetical protein
MTRRSEEEAQMKSWIGWLAFTIVAATMLSSLAAQEYGPERPGQSGHGPPGMGPRGGAPPDPVVLEGPPPPEEFARIVELSDDRKPAYATRYERFMAATRVTRDSLKSLRQSMREAFEGGGAARGLREELEHQQQVFDEGLKDSLSKDEWKRYQKWREERRKQVERDRGERRPPGAEPP